MFLAVIFAATLMALISGSHTYAATPTSLTTGSAHACTLVDDKAKCWGNNASGQLGNNSTSNAATPSDVYTRASYSEQVKDYCKGGIALGDACVGFGASWVYKTVNYPSSPLYGKAVTKISAGQYHTCAIASARAYCWGNNGNGRLGNNSTSDSSRPVAVATNGALRGKELIDVTAGSSFSCALATDGTVACWGQNSNGQLGSGNRNDSRVPVAVTTAGGSALQNKKVKKLAQLKGDVATMCVITREDKVVCWGQNYVGQVGDGSGYAYNRWETGSGSATQRTSNHECSTARREARREAKSSSTINNRYVLLPASVNTSQKIVNLIIVADITDADSDGNINSGYGYVTATTESGQLYFWGGSTDYNNSENCVQINGNLNGTNRTMKATAYYTRAYFTQATPSGPLYTSEKANDLRNQTLSSNSGNAMVGSNHDENKKCVPYKETIWWVTYDRECSQSVSGTSCAVTAANKSAIYCDNTSKTCTDNSNGTKEDIAYLKSIGEYRQICSGPRPVQSGGASWLQPGMTITSMDNGHEGFACAVASNDTIGCWGEGDRGRLGNGSTKDSAVPVRVSGIQ